MSIKKILVFGVLFSSLCSFASTGDASVLNSGLNPQSIRFQINDIKYMFIGNEVTYSTLDFRMDTAKLQAQVLEAKRLGMVVDIIKTEGIKAPVFGRDYLTIQTRPATQAEKESMTKNMQDEILRLQAELSKSNCK